MKALEDKIIAEGKILPGDVLKVGSFLNQQIDTDFLLEMSEEAYSKFSASGVTKILTVEASGIALAISIGIRFKVPVVYAKKVASNVSGDVYSTVIHSYTHNNDSLVVVPKDYINKNDKLLIVDDFLANGKALEGLISIIEQSGAELCGCLCAIEKGFQGGGDKLRKKGIRVESLAIIDSMTDSSIEFRK